MSLIITPTTTGGGGGAILCGNSTSHTYTRCLIRRQVSVPLSSRRPALHVASAKKFSGRNRTKEGTSTTTREQQRGVELGGDDRTAQIDRGQDGKISAVDDGFVMPKLPGDEPDFWEGEKWDGLGFFVEYMWAFGIFFSLIACGIAVVTYNEGATDFKDTPAYKESIQTQDFLQQPDASNPDVFESNPTEVAPSLE